MLGRWIPRPFRYFFLDFSSRVLLEIQAIPSDKVVLYGAGPLGLETYLKLTQAGIEVVLWVDIKAVNAGFCQFDVDVQSTVELAYVDSNTPVVICNNVAIESMQNECYKRGILPKQVLVLQ